MKTTRRPSASGARGPPIKIINSDNCSVPADAYQSRSINEARYFIGVPAWRDRLRNPANGARSLERDSKNAGGMQSHGSAARSGTEVKKDKKIGPGRMRKKLKNIRGSAGGRRRRNEGRKTAEGEREEARSKSSLGNRKRQLVLSRQGRGRRLLPATTACRCRARPLLIGWAEK